MINEVVNFDPKERLKQLNEAKGKGTKIVGYLPGNYVPEELVLAAGAIPICLINGGDRDPLEASLSTITRVFCPFVRSQIGEKLIKNDTYYDLIDLLVIPSTCQHLKKAAEIWEYQNDLPTFKLGIPHKYDNDFEMEYYVDQLKALKNRLQILTGNQITDSRLGETIGLYNQIRSLLNQISLMRRSTTSPLNTLDFVKLNHTSFYTDPVLLVDKLKATCSDLGNKKGKVNPKNPRLIIISPNISNRDYKILELVEEVGGNLVTEEIYEGMRNYQSTIDIHGDPITSLARGYLKERIPPAFMRDSSQKRLEYVLQIIKEFNINGLIWHELLCCETYDSESYFFTREMEKRNIPMLILESDYGLAGMGQMRTRLEAFIEIINGGLE